MEVGLGEGRMVDPGGAVGTCIVNVISRIIFGHAFPHGSPKVAAVQAQIEVMTQVMMSPQALLLSVPNPAASHIRVPTDSICISDAPLAPPRPALWALWL